MVGKTNLTFISKGEASDVQLIQKSYAPGMTGQIYKLEKIDHELFVFVRNLNGSEIESYSVWRGTDASNLSIIKRDRKVLEAMHIIYADERYYFIATDGDNKIYATSDFNIYEEITIPEELEGWENVGLFLDSNGQIVFMHIKKGANSNNHIKIGMCHTLKDTSDWYSIETSFTGDISSYEDSFMENNIIFVRNLRISLLGDLSTTKGLSKDMYMDGYFVQIQAGAMFYRSRDGLNWSVYTDFITEGSNVRAYFPLSGKYGLLYARQSKYYLNVADDILQFGSKKNEEYEVYDDIKESSWVEFEGKTLIGTNSGLIYELQLDYEGIMQRPDVAIIKTLSAKQALAQSLQYTDECIRKVKDYIDQKFQEEFITTDESSTKIETEENGR